MCNRAATVVAVLALLWAVGTLWVIGELRGDLEEIERGIERAFGDEEGTP